MFLYMYRMAIGLKNCGRLVNELHVYYDFAIVEACITNGNCKPFEQFTAANKAVFGVEYAEGDLNSYSCIQFKILYLYTLKRKRKSAISQLI
jgi:hypothetical protein